jgi:hypothetical protein
MRTTIKEAVRTVGYLLETNSHVGSISGTKEGFSAWVLEDKNVCRWCLAGAECLVGKYLLGKIAHSGLDKAIRKTLSIPDHVATEMIWEGPGTNSETRKQVIAKLKNA